MSDRTYPKIFAFLSVGFLCATGQAVVLHVPGDYARIQNAIDASHNGDSILVSPGLYNESINFRGKAITVSSTDPADSGVVRTTIIHAAGQTSAVTFSRGESSNSVLAGFAITGGYGSINPLFGAAYYWGGGIYCYTSAPTIVGNIIIANAAPPASSSIAGYGGGIGCIQSDALITRNLITGNSGYAGGGIVVYQGKARIVSNLIYSNSAAAGGGAALASGGRFFNNTVVANAAPNSSQSGAGNVYAASDTTGQAVVTGNIIASAISGGGLFVDAADKITLVSFNDVWNNNDGNYYSGNDLTGQNGNISQDSQFVDSTNSDFHLRDISPCINAGDPGFQAAPGELDFYGNPRIYARRVDIGASEYFDNFRPVANAGPGQLITVTALPALMTLDGTGSTDPNGAPLSYHWSQVSGPATSLNNAGLAKPSFYALALGTYTFQLIVDNGSFNSFPDTVQVTVTNAPPIADAGACQLVPEGTASITLDGSRSFDPENAGLSYHWKQLSGWIVQLQNPDSVHPVFEHPWPGMYVFQLIVNDGLQDSQPATVTVTVGPNHAPVANAGPARYVATGPVALDGTASYDSDGCGTLSYQWRQISGPAVTMTGTNTSAPLISGFTLKNTIQKCIFQLVVSNGSLSSQPSTVTMTIVPNYGMNALYLENPPFDPARPTIVAFGGGNCTTGSGMSFGGVWDSYANWITVPSYGSSYTSYGDMMMVYLSSVAPDYRKPIQMIGFSTGNKPAMQAAAYVNTTYRDTRYAVNRVALCDAVCNNLSSYVAQFNANPVGREQCWVDNYISNDPAHARASYIPGALNVTCIPARAHSYPVIRYLQSSLDYTNGGLTAFAYLSVIGTGRNYQLNTAANQYYFTINASEAIVFYNQGVYSGKVLAPVQLMGPADGSTMTTNGTVFSCAPVENAVRYQLLFGTNADRVMDYAVMSDTTNPPTQLIAKLPADSTWWTVRANDRFNSAMYADPRLIRRVPNHPPIADAGPDQVLYAELDGQVTVTLDGSRSSDPDGDALSYTWAWLADGSAYLSNGVSLTLTLPVGVHTFELMVNDGQANSQPALVTVTVVAPLECKLKISPSTINLRGNGNGPQILATVRFPDAASAALIDTAQPLLLYPGEGLALKQWVSAADGALTSLRAFFSRDSLAGVAQTGPAELTVVGKLGSGRWFYGRDTVQVLAPPRGGPK